MPGYEWYVTQFAYTLSYVCLVWPIFGLVWLCSGGIPKSQRTFPLWKFVAIAAMGSFTDLVGYFPTSHLGGALQVTLVRLVSHLARLTHLPCADTGWQQHP